MIGILSVGSLNCTGATITANGGDGTNIAGGGGAVVLITQGTYTAPTTLTVTKGVQTGGNGIDEDGLTYTLGSATAQFCQKPWLLGD
jgi:hypothetical protein